ncbi:MAG TPA: DUF1292 domain-containing protein [Tenericutes bacterium]|nr:DUF1292 domain-containing protein [Mycoplasmatota bacterium]
MDNVIVVGTNNEKANIFVVRYFEYNNKKYLIYTLNEKDETGYVKLYVSKVVEQNGTVFANGINDEEEWTEIKDLIKIIIKEVRDGELKSARDLNPSVLNNAVIVDFRAFKLVANIVDILSTNKNIVEENNVVNAMDNIENDVLNNNLTEKEDNLNEMTSFDELMGNNLPEQSGDDNKPEELPSFTPSYEEPTYQPEYDYENKLNNTEIESANNEIVNNITENTEVSLENNTNNSESNHVYKELYEKLLDEKKQIEQELYELKSQMNVIKNILEQEK